MKLKPSTTFDFTDDDLLFVIELAKVGHVSLLSNQVSLISKPGYSETNNLNFKDSMGKYKCNGLQLPANWCIEWIGVNNNILHVTFGVKKP